MKTRHGKILTTVGEVLHLSEEDFQKVRTNRKKKDSTPEVTKNVNKSVSNVIVDFVNQHDDEQRTMNANTTTEYVLKENVDDVNRIWKTEEVTQFVNDCFEICTESHLDKTDGIETEITIDCRNPDRDDSNMECINDVQEDGLIQLNSPIYDNVEVTNNTDPVYHHNEDYQNEDSVSRVENYEHPQINRNNEILRTGDQEDNSIHILQNSNHDYHKLMYDGDNQDKSITYVHLKTKQAESVSSDKNNQIHDEEVIGKYTEDNVAVCTEVTSANVNILQTFDKAVENIPLNHDVILEERDHVSESVMSDLNILSANPTETNQPKIDQSQNSQYLYVCTEPLNKVMAQSKYINIPLRQIMWCRDKQNQLQMTEDNCRKIRVLSSEDVRAINIKQFDKQNTILLVSNDNLKNDTFQVEKDNITAKDMNR